MQLGKAFPGQIKPWGPQAAADLDYLPLDIIRDMADADPLCWFHHEWAMLVMVLTEDRRSPSFRNSPYRATGQDTTWIFDKANGDGAKKWQWGRISCDGEGLKRWICNHIFYLMEESEVGHQHAFPKDRTPWDGDWSLSELHVGKETWIRWKSVIEIATVQRNIKAQSILELLRHTDSVRVHNRDNQELHQKMLLTQNMTSGCLSIYITTMDEESSLWEASRQPIATTTMRDEAQEGIAVDARMTARIRELEVQKHTTTMLEVLNGHATIPHLDPSRGRPLSINVVYHNVPPPEGMAAPLVRCLYDYKSLATM